MKTTDCQCVKNNGQYHLPGPTPLRIFPWTFSGVAAYLISSLGSCALMLILFRRTEAFLYWYFPVFFLLTGTALAWLSLRQWRELYPVRCAFVLGLSSGLAGSSAYYFFLQAFIRLLF